jgi:hypothetical protein
MSFAAMHDLSITLGQKEILTAVDQDRVAAARSNRFRLVANNARERVCAHQSQQQSLR